MMADNVFYPNACHVCKKYGKGVCLLICPRCRMISYCDVVHQEEHWPQHRMFCNAIKEEFENATIQYMNTKEVSSEKWNEITSKFKDVVTTKLRFLKRYERQMFCFARACVICYRQVELIDCKNCPCASFCKKHKNKQSEHANHCKTLKMCFEVDIMENQVQIDVSTIDILPESSLSSYDDMTSFLDKCAFRNSEVPPSHVSKLLYSEYLTKPLTLLFAINRLNLSLKEGNLVVHDIATRLGDIDLTNWEALLHGIPSLISLTIITISPKYDSINYKIGHLNNEIIINFCDNCTKMGKKIVYDHYHMFYRDYVRTENFKKPDIIVGFNAMPYDFYDINNTTIKLSDEWMASAQALMEQNCPYILTFLGLLPDDVQERINTANCIFAKKNPFSSLRPQRNTLFECSYKNQYLVIYENIKNNLFLIEED